MKDFIKRLGKSPLAIVGLFWICVAVLITLTINFPVQVATFFTGVFLCVAVALVSYMVYDLARLALR